MRCNSLWRRNWSPLSTCVTRNQHYCIECKVMFLCETPISRKHTFSAALDTNFWRLSMYIYMRIIVLFLNELCNLQQFAAICSNFQQLLLSYFCIMFYFISFYLIFFFSSIFMFRLACWDLVFSQLILLADAVYNHTCKIFSIWSSSSCVSIDNKIQLFKIKTRGAKLRKRNKKKGCTGNNFFENLES